MPDFLLKEVKILAILLMSYKDNSGMSKPCDSCPSDTSKYMGELTLDAETP